MKKISATLITFNEEDKIGRALESVAPVADEIVVVDSLSTDATLEICRRYTDRVVQRPWPGYRVQKQQAVELATHDWILSVDADEVISGPLADALRTWKASSSDDVAAFRIRRKTFFLGCWIDHTSWAKDWQVRLFHRPQARWTGGRVHESVEVTGSVGRMPGILEHYTYASVSEYLAQLQNFSSLSAADALDAGRRCNWGSLLLLPPVEFLRNFIVLRGFMDGVPGLAVSGLCAVSVFFRYLKLWEMQRGLSPVTGSRDG